MTPETKQHFFYIALILLVGSGSFGLGRLSAVESRKVPVKIDYFTSTSTTPTQAASAALAPIPGVNLARKEVSASTTPAKAARIVASKKGKRYYYETCSGAKSLAEANKVYFNSAPDAEAVGLTLAAGCNPPK